MGNHPNGAYPRIVLMPIRVANKPALAGLLTNVLTRFNAWRCKFIQEPSATLRFWTVNDSIRRSCDVLIAWRINELKPKGV